MIRTFLTVTFFVFLHSAAYTQKVPINDGPYVFIKKNKLISKEVMNGKVEKNKLEMSAYRTEFDPEPSVVTGVEKVAALSDIHGQFDLALEILQNNGVIDKDRKWSFGTGHFVIVGDIFDRGPKVTETLWFIFELEMQAKKVGGHVHFLLGNHEYMILRGDLRYLNPKYVEAEGKLKVSYDELYGPETVLGNWLRSKSTVLKLNDDIYVHGGISRNFVDSVDWNLQEINDQMREAIDRPYEELDSLGLYDTFYGSEGPVWYRGYFYGKLSQAHVDSLLEDMEADHVIVGHCSIPEIMGLHNNRIFGVDSSIKKGEYGEILFVRKDQFSKGTKEGQVIFFE